MKTTIAKIVEGIENQKRLVSNTEYMEWLYVFTNSHPKFSDTDWLYEKDSSMSDKDYEQVEHLTDFFTAIDKYHTKNLLNANTEGYTAWYNIKYKDAYFAIGICVGQGAYNFVTRYESYDKMFPEPFIDFDYILQNKIAPGVEQKQAKLKQLEELIDEMKDIGTPLSAIHAVVAKAFKSDN